MSGSPYYPYIPPIKPKPDDKPKPDELKLVNAYRWLRLDLDAIEQLLDKPESLTEQDIKRLDKSITVIKVGFKNIKKVLKSRCFSELKPIEIKL